MKQMKDCECHCHHIQQWDDCMECAHNDCKRHVLECEHCQPMKQVSKVDPIHSEGYSPEFARFNILANKVNEIIEHINAPEPSNKRGQLKQKNIREELKQTIGPFTTLDWATISDKVEEEETDKVVEELLTKLDAIISEVIGENEEYDRSKPNWMAMVTGRNNIKEEQRNKWKQMKGDK